LVTDTVHEERTTPFYLTGGTMPADAPSYIERKADTDLLDCLLRGEYCYLLNARQIGKSSLMIRTANRLREAGCTVAVLDLTAVGQGLDSERWYFGLLDMLGQQLGLEDELEDYWEEHERLGPFQRWMSAGTDMALPKVDSRLVVFVDETDAVRSLPFSTDEFFPGVQFSMP